MAGERVCAMERAARTTSCQVVADALSLYGGAHLAIDATQVGALRCEWVLRGTGEGWREKREGWVFGLLGGRRGKGGRGVTGERGTKGGGASQEKSAGRRLEGVSNGSSQSVKRVPKGRRGRGTIGIKGRRVSLKLVQWASARC